MVSNMWKSPIEIQQDIVRQVDMVIEGGVMKAIQRFDINVDKEELIKALKYDRDQYEKGYQDGITETNVGKWIPCSERLPDDYEIVNITWVNRNPEPYYKSIKDKPFTGTAIYYNGKWYWYSCVCEDYLAECGDSTCDRMDKDIEVIAWMPLPEPYKGE